MIAAIVLLAGCNRVPPGLKPLGEQHVAPLDDQAAIIVLATATDLSRLELRKEQDYAVDKLSLQIERVMRGDVPDSRLDVYFAALIHAYSDPPINTPQPGLRAIWFLRREQDYFRLASEPLQSYIGPGLATLREEQWTSSLRENVARLLLFPDGHAELPRFYSDFLMRVSGTISHVGPAVTKHVLNDLSKSKDRVLAANAVAGLELLREDQKRRTLTERSER